MKLMRTEDAIGQVLCHDITQIIPGSRKARSSKKAISLPRRTCLSC